MQNTYCIEGDDDGFDFTLMVSKIFHDLASVLNALGLILELGQEEPSEEQSNKELRTDLSVAYQSYQKVLDVLAFYRILFSKTSGILARSLEYMHSLCQREDITFDCENVQEGSLSNQSQDEYGKVTLCLFSLIKPLLPQVQSFRIRQYDENFQWEFEVLGNIAPSTWSFFQDTSHKMEARFPLLFFLKNLLHHLQIRLPLSFEKNHVTIWSQGKC